MVGGTADGECRARRKTEDTEEHGGHKRTRGNTEEHGRLDGRRWRRRWWQLRAAVELHGGNKLTNGGDVDNSECNAYTED